MEIVLNKQENTKTSEFVSFSIREYVAEIRKKDRKKCWPFGSLGDPEKYDVFASYQSVDSTFLCSQNYPSDHIDGSDDKPEHKEASNSSNKETLSGKEDRSQTTDSKSCKVIYKAENSANEGGDNDKPGRNQPRRKHQKLCLLSDILRNLDNVNTRFPTESKEERDDIITLDASFSRKQKGVKVTTMSKSKMMTNGVEETRFEKEEKSKCGSRKTRIDDDVDFQAMEKRRKVRLVEENGTETTNEDSEMEAVMLLATHFFNQENPSSSIDDAKRAQIVHSNMEMESLEGEASKHKYITTYSQILSSTSGGNRSENDQGFARGATCACVHKKIRARLGTEDRSSTAAIFENSLTLVCSINRNPADFSIPNAQNVFMRGG